MPSNPIRNIKNLLYSLVHTYIIFVSGQLFKYLNHVRGFINVFNVSNNVLKTKLKEEK